MKVVELHPTMDAHDVVKALRNIADDIEVGEYGFSPNLAAVVLARESVRRSVGGEACSYQWQTDGIGEGATVFRIRGLLSAASVEFEGGNDA